MEIVYIKLSNVRFNQMTFKKSTFSIKFKKPQTYLEAVLNSSLILVTFYKLQCGAPLLIILMVKCLNTCIMEFLLRLNVSIHASCNFSYD